MAGFGSRRAGGRSHAPDASPAGGPARGGRELRPGFRAAAILGAVLAAAGFAAAGAALEAPPAAKEPARPNFVVIVADDVSAEDLGPYGHRRVRTPNLDRLAREGLRFDRAFLTCSSCSPSRASLLTERYPHNTGAEQLHSPLPASQRTVAERLREAGYYTAAAGKWHLGAAARAKFDRVRDGGGPSGCGEWLSTLRERPRDRPFVLWLAAFDAHRPYSPGAVEPPHRPEDALVPPYLPDVPETRADLALYYDEIARLDRFVGEVVAELEAQGAAARTLLLFLSDNGRPFPRCKTTLYDSGIRTPLLARWPGRVPPGSRCDRLVSAIDLAPTLLELAGLPPEPAFQGRSFATLLTNPGAPFRDAIFAEHNWHDFDDHQRAVRTARYKYIRTAYTDVPLTPPADAISGPTFQVMRRLRDAGRLTPAQRSVFETPRPAEELYDLERDPNELRNLAADPRHAETLARLRAELDRWIEATGDRIPPRRTPDAFDRETGRRIGIRERSGE